MAATAGIGSTTPTTAQSSQDIFSGMGPDAFLKLLVAQLRYQNPMNPSDPTAMMGQVAQYAQVEALTKMQKGQATDQSLSEAKLATEMVGKTISATDGTSTETGKVLSARFTSTGPVLILDTGAEVTLSAVVSVTDTAPPVAAASGTGSSSTGSSSSSSTTASTTAIASTASASSTPTASSTTSSTSPTTAAAGATASAAASVVPTAPASADVPSSTGAFTAAAVNAAMPDNTVHTIVDPALSQAAIAAYAASGD